MNGLTDTAGAVWTVLPFVLGVTVALLLTFLVLVVIPAIARDLRADGASARKAKEDAATVPLKIDPAARPEKVSH